jgi:cephalosporin-C deacetylase
MAFFDLPPGELREYRSAVQPPKDFREFWDETLRAAATIPIEAKVHPVPTGYRLVSTFDVKFSGYGGHPISAWLRYPSNAKGPLPAVVQFVGYGGGRGLSMEPSPWSLAGFAHLIVDTRGQGAAWLSGDTPDPEGGDAGEPSVPGMMTRGISDPRHYYYRRVFTDAVRAVQTARILDVVDASLVFLDGTSQGGGIALATAGMTAGLAGVTADVPFLCDFPRAITLTDNEPYGEIARYLKVHHNRIDRALDTLNYFDVVNHVPTASAPALFSVAFMDRTCPPSTVYGAYNAYGGIKEIVEYPFNAHEGGLVRQT